MGFDASNGYGIDVKLPPIRILPEDGIAIQKRRADGTICTARRGNHILCVSPDFRSEDFFALASEAGCRMYAPPHCTVYGDSRFMAFFPQQDQNAVLFLPEAGEYEELLTGKHCSGFATWPVRLKAKDALVFMRV